MLPNDDDLSRMRRKWEDDQEREYQAHIDAHIAPEPEDENENNDKTGC